MNAGEADPDGPATRAVVAALVARVAAASEEFAAMLIPAGAIDALCAVCVRHSEGGEAFETARSVAAATETMRELAKSTTLRPGLRTALDVRALVETARYVPRRVGASAGAAGGEGANDDDDDARKRSREEARKFALTTMHALADPDKNDDAADFRARLRAGDGGHRDGLSALASCLEAPDAEVAIGLKEHAARCVADLAFDEGPCRDECLGSGPRCPSLGKTLRSIVASRSTPSLKLKAAAACAMWRATAPSGEHGAFTAEDAARTSGRIGSLVHAKGVLEGLVRLLRKPTKEETKPPPTAAEVAAAEEAARKKAELAEFEKLEREASASDGAEPEPEAGPDADERTGEASEGGARGDEDKDDEDDDEDEDEDGDGDDKDGGGGDGEPPDDGGGGDGEKKPAKNKKPAKKKKGGKRGKKGKKKGPTPGLLDGYVASVPLIRRMCVDDVETIRRLHTLGAHLHLAKLRGHEDVRVRAGADATLRAMGGEPLAAAEMRAAEGAPAWHGRLNLPGVALGELEMPASAREKLHALLPGAQLD